MDQARDSFCHYHQWNRHPRYSGTLLRFSYNHGVSVTQNFPITTFVLGTRKTLVEPLRRGVYSILNQQYASIVTHFRFSLFLVSLGILLLSMQLQPYGIERGSYVIVPISHTLRTESIHRIYWFLHHPFLPLHKQIDSQITDHN